MNKTKTFAISSILFSLMPLGASSEEVPINKGNLLGEWECVFSMQGNKIFTETWNLEDGNKFNISAKVQYFLDKENAHFSYNADGKWTMTNETIKLVYEPFEFESQDEYSKKYVSDIEHTYITPAWNGTRRFAYYIESLSDSKMQIGDDYDSWQCVRK